MELKVTVEIKEGTENYEDLELFVKDILENCLYTNESEGSIDSFKLKVEEIKKDHTIKYGQ